MRSLVVVSALLIATVALWVLFFKEGEASKEGGNGPSSESQAFATIAEPEAENPDRDRWIDLASIPFRPEWVHGTLKVVRGQAPETLNNLLWVGGDARTYARDFLYPFLLLEGPDARDGVLSVTPWAAESLPQRSADQRTTTWTLKEGLTWEDGTKVSAADYEFSWQMLRNPAVRAGTRRAALEAVEAVTAVDERTFTVRFKAPYYNDVVTFGLEFTVVPKHAVPHDPAAFNEDRERRHIGFGPYRVVQQDQQSLTFELRSEYRSKPHPIGPHYVERVLVRFTTNPQGRWLELCSGNVHVDVLSHDLFQRAKDDAEFRKQCWRAPYFLPAYAFCAWNMKDPSDPDHVRPHPVLGDARVRQALSHLFPRERFCRDHLQGLGVPVSGPLFFKDADYAAEIAARAFDPILAGKLLDQADYRLAEDGTRKKDGRPLVIDLAFPSESTWLRPLATLFVEEARKVGVLVKQRDLVREPMLALMKGHAFDGFMHMNRLSPSIEPDIYGMFHSAEARLQADNWTGLEDSRIDEVINAYRTSFEPLKRSVFRKQIHRILAEVEPMSFLVSAASCVAVSRLWANVKIHDVGLAYRDFVWRERWRSDPPR